MVDAELTFPKNERISAILQGNKIDLTIKTETTDFYTVFVQVM